jgi:hypothetical protein
MVDALEMAREIFHLPAFVRANLLALDAATGAGTFSRVQLVDLDSYRKVFEVSKIPPSFAPLHAAKFFLRFTAGWKIVRVNRLAIHLLGEVEKHLGQITRGLQTIGARTVVPLAIPLQLQLEPQILNVKIVDAPALLFGKLLVYIGTSLLLIALIDQRAQHCFQRLAVIGQSNKIGFAGRG